MCTYGLVWLAETSRSTDAFLPSQLLKCFSAIPKHLLLYIISRWEIIGDDQILVELLEACRADCVFVQSQLMDGISHTLFFL